jgi:hypothetical protein
MPLARFDAPFEHPDWMGSASFRLSCSGERAGLVNAHARFAPAPASDSFLEGSHSGTAARCRIPRQRIRVSRVGADVDAVLGSRDFPIPDHSFIIGKELAFSGDHSFHERARLRIPGREMSNLIEISMIIEHIREDYGVPDCEGHLQGLPGSVLRRLAREITHYGCREVQERL